VWTHAFPNCLPLNPTKFVQTFRNGLSAYRKCLRNLWLRLTRIFVQKPVPIPHFLLSSVDQDVLHPPNWNCHHEIFGITFYTYCTTQNFRLKQIIFWAFMALFFSNAKRRQCPKCRFSNNIAFTIFWFNSQHRQLILKFKSGASKGL